MWRVVCRAAGRCHPAVLSTEGRAKEDRLPFRYDFVTVADGELSIMAKISRYTVAQGPEAEFQPGSHGRVLRNLLGITSKREMDRVEYDALARVQEQYLGTINTGTRFTASLLSRMHQDWLGRIYAWSGKYRSVELHKDGFRWPPAARVGENMATFEKELLARHTPCRPDSLQNAARRIAQVHAELLLIHPFRDGNGRLARWLADIMASQAGFPLPKYEFSGKGSVRQREKYLSAVTHGYGRDYEPLTAFFVEAVTRRLEETF